MMMLRKDGWETRLAELIESKRNIPFCWKTNNCLGFVAEAEIAVQGFTEFPEALRPMTNKFSAMKIIKKNADSLDDWIDKKYQRISILSAQRGDICMIETAEGAAVGVCLGHNAAFIGKDGLEFMPMSLSIKAWRV